MCQYAQHARRQQEGLHAHIGEAGDGTGGVIGMQRGKYQVAGQAGLYRDLCSFQIAYLADHDHVRVLPQNGAQRAGKGHVDTRVDLSLADTIKIVFNRVFHRHHIGHAGVDTREGGVERGGFTRAGRAGDQHNAVRLVHQLVYLVKGNALHAELFKIETARILIQQTQHHAFAMAGRQGRDTHIHRTTRQSQRDTPILRQAFFGNVQLGHNFETRHHCGMQGAVRLDHILQCAVNTVTHDRAGFKRLDVDVRSIVTHGLGQQGVNHADHRRIIFCIKQVFGLRQVVHQLREIHVHLNITHHGSGRPI